MHWGYYNEAADSTTLWNSTVHAGTLYDKQWFSEARKGNSWAKVRKWGKKSCSIRSINEARRKETKTSYQDVMVPEAHDDDEAMHRSDLSDPMPAQSKTLREFPFEPIPSERRRIIEVQVQQKHPENMGKIDLVHISRNATVQYPTMLHSEQKIAYFWSEWSVVGYRTGAFWDLRLCGTTYGRHAAFRVRIF